jgi:hypothetical protein
MEVNAMRKFGGEILDDILLPMIRHIAERQVYPRVIAVSYYHKDAYGRSWVEAIDDEGKAEKIFTKEPLDPGVTYFMVAKTNPARIDPLLIRRQGLGSTPR